MKVITIVGARPQFIKATLLRKLLHDAGHHELLIHTGQHYDYNMSDIFFKELGIQAPDYNLGIGSGSSGSQISNIILKLEPLLLDEKPKCIIVYGDTNSTLAAALASVKVGIPIVHIESGERNFTTAKNIVHPATIPEETNRVLTDHLSTLLFCSSERAVLNLRREGIENGVSYVGDVSLDIFLQTKKVASERSSIIEDLGLIPGQYTLVTVHRAINTDQVDRLKNILSALSQIPHRVVFPMHPRTNKAVHSFGLQNLLQPPSNNITVIEPVGYLDMISLEQNARLIITDSGGVIREAFFSGVPSVNVDDTTEWIDLVESGWSSLTGAVQEQIICSSIEPRHLTNPPRLFGDGQSCHRIISLLEEWAVKNV